MNRKESYCLCLSHERNAWHDFHSKTSYSTRRAQNHHDKLNFLFQDLMVSYDWNNKLGMIDPLIYITNPDHTSQPQNLFWIEFLSFPEFSSLPSRLIERAEMLVLKEVLGILRPLFRLLTSHEKELRLRPGQFCLEISKLFLEVTDCTSTAVDGITNPRMGFVYHAAYCIRSLGLGEFLKDFQALLWTINFEEESP